MFESIIKDIIFIWGPVRGVIRAGGCPCLHVYEGVVTMSLLTTAALHSSRKLGLMEKIVKIDSDSIQSHYLPARGVQNILISNIEDFCHRNIFPKELMREFEVEPITLLTHPAVLIRYLYSFSN